MNMQEEPYANEKRIPVISIVGWSGTGKTACMERLIAALKARGLSVAAVKHDAHRFEMDKEGKDSWRMTRAGADVTVIASEEKTVIMENRRTEPEDILARIRDVDLILTEGYKYGDWPKLLVYREAVGKPLLTELSSCLAVVTDDRVDTELEVIPFKDIERMVTVILKAAGLLP